MNKHIKGWEVGSLRLENLNDKHLHSPPPLPLHIEDKYGHLHKSCCVRKLIILSELGCAKVTQYFLTKQVFNESSEVALVQLRMLCSFGS